MEQGDVVSGVQMEFENETVHSADKYVLPQCTVIPEQLPAHACTGAHSLEKSEVKGHALVRKQQGLVAHLQLYGVNTGERK
jgi:hypothetical protein